MNPDSGMVVIQPSTGNVLAIASNSKTVAGLAYHATRAPGSTFKTVTASALMSGGHEDHRQRRLHADREAWAPRSTTTTRAWPTASPGATLLSAYEQSCNTSFVNASLAHLKSDDRACRTRRRTSSG